MFLLSKSAVRWCVSFCIWCSCILSDIIKIAKQINICFAILVRFVQTYSVFKQIAKSICNEYSICFSSQKLPYSGASVFVLWGSSPYNPKNNKKAIRYKYLMAFLVRCRSRHSVSKGPPDLSPKFFRFAQNLDTRVRAPTTQNNKITVRNKS